MSDLPMPKGWAQASLGDLADFTNGKAFKKEEWLETGKPIIRIQNLNNSSAKFNYADDSHEEKYLVRNGDLLVSWSASLGVYYWNSGDAWLNQHIFRVDNLRGCDKNYLKYALEISIEDFYAKAHGMGMVHITKGNFESHLVPLPPIAEQTRIAAKLDELLAQLNILKARIDSIPALLKRFRQSVLAAATDGTLTESWRQGSKTAFEWRSAIFSELLREFRGGASKKPSDLMEGVPVIRSSAVRSMNVDFSDIRYFDIVAELDHRNFVQEGDLLFTRLSGSPEFVGVCALVKTLPKNPTQFPDRLFCARLKDIKNGPYLEIFFSSQTYLDYIKNNLKSSAGHQRITTETVKSSFVLLPTPAEQTEIVRRTEQLFGYANQLEAKVNAARKRIDQMTQSILAKAFRGELVTQDPSDEPASVILERIKAQRATAPKTKRGRQPARSG